MTRISPHTLTRMTILLLFTLLLAACGGGAEATQTPAEAAPTDTSAPTAAPTATEAAATPTETEDDEEEGSGGGSLVVEISNFGFNPETATVKVGTTVTWLHRDGGASHTVTADDGSFSSGLMSENDRFSFTFDTPGTYAYYCEFHGGAGGAGMSGVITVEE